MQLEVKVARHLETLSPDHNNGLWVSADEELIKLNAEGREVLRLAPFSGEEKKLIALVADPVAGGVWVAAKRAIRYVEADGQARPSLALTHAKQKRKIRALALYSDSLPPLLSFRSPAGGSYLPIHQPLFELHYEDSGIGVDTAALAITEQGQLLSVSCTHEADRANCTPTTPLAEGAHTLRAEIADFNGNRSDLASVAFTVDTVPPAAPDPTRIQVTAPEAGTVTVAGAAGGVEPNAVLIITNTRSGESVTVTANSDGSFTAQIAAQAGDTLEIRVTDAAGNQSDTRSLSVGGSSRGLPPDPATVAPDLSTSGITPLADATAFLYSGADPIQTGVAEGTIEPSRAAVIRGKVLNRGKQSLSGVTLTVKDHPELGQTLSRADGMFDMAVNGGGLLTIHYEKPGYLPAQRQVQTPWQDYALVDDVVMVGLDQQVTTIDLSSNAPIQIAQGSVVTDQDGTRQATVFFPAGTSATMTLADGTTQSLTTLAVRATEYTVGENGPQAMPGPLPTSSGYTYAVELSVDAALAAGAMRVDFDQPLPLYVDNFLNFPVGGIVPAGWYDREKAAWIPADNGKIIQLLGVDANGRAELDTDGNGKAADTAKLAQLGITEAERLQLAKLYTPGKSLWRVPVSHFTPWDCNWPFGPPLDGTSPPPSDDPRDPPPDEDSDECEGCGINPQARTVGEVLPITATPYALHYQSRRAKGYQPDKIIDIALAGASVPASLKGIELSVTVAGQSFTRSFPAAPNQSYRFEWDDLDAYARPVTGSAPATVTVGYRYNVVYYAARSEFEQSFAQTSAEAGTAVIGSRYASTITLTRTWQEVLAGDRTVAQAQGGWSLSTHHSYDAVRQILALGTGERREASHAYRAITTIAGTGQATYGGDGGPAARGALHFPEDIALGPDGSLYIADTDNHRIRRVGADGRITTVAGAGQRGYGGDGGPAAQATLSFPEDIALGPDGSLYIADTNNHRIRRVGPDGIITTVAGTGQQGYSGDGGPAAQAKFYYPWGIAVGPDGSLYIADTNNHRIRRVGPDGRITTVAGTGQATYGGDGGPAVRGALHFPEDIALGPDGSLYIADTNNHRIRRVGPDGIITTVAGTGQQGYSGDAGPAAQAKLYYPGGVAVGPDGGLYIADTNNHRIRRLGVGLPKVSLNEALIPSAAGLDLYHFDAKGKHLRTLSTLTGAELYRFAYDFAGSLIEIKDLDGDVTRIERDSEGNPTAIVGPDGQRTSLTLDSNGYLAALTNPAGETHTMSYTAEGLMTAFTDPKGNTNRFEYDALGRLMKDTNAGGGGWSVTATEQASGYTTELTTGEGKTIGFAVEYPSTGDRRQVNTYPDGTLETRLFKTSGEETTTAPDGTVTTLIEGPDPRFGMQSPVPASRTLTLPSGLRLSTSVSRMTILSNPADLLSLSLLSDTVTVNGKAYKRSYGAATKTWTGTSAAGRQRTTLIDSQGRPLTRHTVGLEPVRYRYDNRGRLTEATAGQGDETRTTSIRYYEEGPRKGYVQAITDALDRSVSYDYDLAGRVTRQTMPDGGDIAYGYDANGNLTEIVPPGQPPHRFDHTPLDQEEKYTPPDVGDWDPATRYQYNLDEQLTRVTRPDGQTVEMSYTSSGQLEVMRLPSGDYRYAYNPRTGQLRTLTAPDGESINVTYDGFLPQSTTWAGEIAGTVSRSYTTDLEVRERSVNTSPIAFSYDADGLLTKAGDLSLTRDPQNGLVSSTLLGNTATALRYNGFGESLSSRASFITGPEGPENPPEDPEDPEDPETSELTHSSAGHRVKGLLLSGFAALNPVPSAQAVAPLDNSSPADPSETVLFATFYTRDKLGRLTEKTETLGGVSTTYAYTYDAAGRLIEVKQNGVTTASYGYDQNGNRTEVNGVTMGQYDAQDRLTAYADTLYSYTQNGELASKTTGAFTTTYDYDVLGNLRHVTLPGSTRFDYVIDGRNRRIGKKVDDVLAQGFLYQDQLKLIAELDGNSQVVSRFVYADKPNVPAYLIKGGVTYRIISDHLGSPRLIINQHWGRHHRPADGL